MLILVLGRESHNSDSYVVFLLLEAMRDLEVGAGAAVELCQHLGQWEEGAGR